MHTNDVVQGQDAQNEWNGQAVEQDQQPKAIREYTLKDEKEKSYYMYLEQAQKAAKALTFFRKNPAFDEFIRLVRSGAIQF